MKKLSFLMLLIVFATDFVYAASISFSKNGDFEKGINRLLPEHSENLAVPFSTQLNNSNHDTVAMDCPHARHEEGIDLGSIQTKNSVNKSSIGSFN